MTDENAEIDMTPEDAARWEAARTLADLGELTALWLEGTIKSMPGYYGGSDGETRDLIAVLAAVNRAGYATTVSPPREPPVTGYDGETWIQRAAVEGFAGTDVLGDLRAHVAATPLILVATPAASTNGTWETRIPVTLDGDTENTAFGGVPPVSHLDDIYGDCHPDLITAITSAWQVTIVYPEWGRNDVLWPALAAFAAECGPGSPHL